MLTGLHVQVRSFGSRNQVTVTVSSTRSSTINPTIPALLTSSRDA